MKLDKFSFGTGDRFHHQGEPLLKAIMDANKDGMAFVPVFNKSNREHTLIGTKPEDQRTEADQAKRDLGWQGNCFVDADHINLFNVDAFISSADFFTLDVAQYIGKRGPDVEIDNFIRQNAGLIGEVKLSEINTISIDKNTLEKTAEQYLLAVDKAQELYQHITTKKGTAEFITEISMDEVEMVQSPAELLIVLKMISDRKIPVQTIAPRFTGRFNKGVEWKGDITRFENDFELDLLVLDFAVKKFGLPDNLKLSIHSGSDKFAIYPAIGSLIKKYDAGIHVKTAGTTWLAEVIGLALSGRSSLELVKQIYTKGLTRFEELAGPYEHVIEIDKCRLPDVADVNTWDRSKFVNSLRHVSGHPDYNPDFRQMLHVSFKIAAEYGTVFTNALKSNKDIIAKEVYDNIYNRHLKKLHGV